jgi:hypothetical protein
MNETTTLPSNFIGCEAAYYSPETDTWPVDVAREGRFPVVVPHRLVWSLHDANLGNQANYNVFTQKHADYEGRFWWPVRDGHGTYGIAIRDVEGCPAEILEDLEALEDNALMWGAEDELVRLEAEAESEAWEDYGEGDFMLALQSVLHAERVGFEFEDCEPRHIRQAYRTLCDVFGVYPVVESGESVYFAVEHIAAELNRALKVWDSPAAEGETPPPNVLAARLAKAVVQPDPRGMFLGGDVAVIPVLRNTWEMLRKLGPASVGVLRDRVQEVGPDMMWEKLIREPRTAWGAV